jgi:hypothetical protein
LPAVTLRAAKPFAVVLRAAKPFAVVLSAAKPFAVVLSAAKPFAVVLSAAKDLHVLFLLALLTALSATAQPARRAIPPLPVPVTNNAVATLDDGPGAGVYSLLGIDTTKRWSGITRDAWVLPHGASRWVALPPVPGPVGRLASLAFGVRGRVILLGGYTVDAAGQERSLPNVDIWDPATRQWRAGAPMPVAVDDAVGGVWRDSLILIVSGWHDTDNVPDVQWYDVARDRWMRGDPFPGIPVFGAAGAVLGDEVLVVDGARRATGPVKYVLAPQAWHATITGGSPPQLRWRDVSRHPGPARYRAALTGACGRFLLAGGTDNPYNYDGVGYDGTPSAPLDALVAFSPATDTWQPAGAAPAATMDHRSAARVGRDLWLVGGMRAGQRVSADVVRLTPACARTGAR